MMNVNPEDVLSEEEIKQHLSDAFNKFESSGDGRLGQWEFMQAWSFLGLKGSEEEIKESFTKVDTDGSGLIDLNEFIEAIRGERMLELSLGNVLKKMGVQYDSRANAFEAFQKTAARRRLMKKQWEENIAAVTKRIIEKLSMLSNVEVPSKDPEEAKMYQTLRDTFDAFDRDGSAQLGIEEYMESWKFLNRPGSDADIKKCFDSVDVDGSGLVEWSEYAFSLMGESALKFGPLADLELLDILLKDTEQLLQAMRDDMIEMQGDNEGRAKRNAELRERLTKMKGEMGSSLGKVMGKMLGIMGMDPRDLLTEEQIDKLLVATFKKFDEDDSKILELPGVYQSLEISGLEGRGRRNQTSFRRS
jgi:Ca2+-binding EF-hand superfamily protein